MVRHVQGGDQLTWEDWRAKTEPRRQQLRCGTFESESLLPDMCSLSPNLAGAWMLTIRGIHCRELFAERLEVIAYDERRRRGTVGWVLLVRAPTPSGTTLAHCVLYVTSLPES